MTYRLSPPVCQFVGSDGNPLAGGLLYFFATGTSTPANTYQDPALSIANTNPIVLDSGGYAPSIFLTPGQGYKVILTDVNGVQQWAQDPVSDPTTGGGNFTSVLAVTDGAGATKSVLLETAGVKRFGLATDASAESGANAGSNFVLTAYDDSGNALHTIFIVNRATGVTDFQIAPTINGKAIGAYIPSSNFAEGLSITVTSDTAISVAASHAVLAASDRMLSVARAGIALTLGTGTSGADGIDTGGITSSTWYNVFIIDNGTKTAGLLSLSATAPTLPTGYTFFMRVGAVRTDGSSHLLRTLQKGTTAQYVVTAATNTAALPIMGSGTAGSLSGAGWVAIALAAFVPPTASRIRGIANMVNGQVMVAPNNAYGAFNSTTNPPPVLAVSGGSDNSIPFDFVLESTNIYWAANTGVLLTQGWVDGVPVC